MLEKLNVIFVCSGNSCRSQMAVGWARHLHPAALRPFSAGTHPRGRIDPLAIQVMKEVGIDIADQEIHPVEAFLNSDMDWAIAVCDGAAEACPTFPKGVRMLSHPFEDPPLLSAGLDAEARLAVYRRVRDEIRAFVAQLPARLGA